MNSIFNLFSFLSWLNFGLEEWQWTVTFFLKNPLSIVIQSNGNSISPRTGLELTDYLTSVEKISIMPEYLISGRAFSTNFVKIAQSDVLLSKVGFANVPIFPN